MTTNPKFEIPNPKSNRAFRKNTRRHYIFLCRARFRGDVAAYEQLSARSGRHRWLYIRWFNVRSRPRHALKAIHALERFSLSMVSVSGVFRASFTLVARFDFRDVFENRLFYGRLDARFFSAGLRAVMVCRRRFAEFDGIYKSLVFNRRIHPRGFGRTRFSFGLHRFVAWSGKSHADRYGWLFCQNRANYGVFVRNLATNRHERTRKIY